MGTTPLRVECIDAERPAGWLADRLDEQPGLTGVTVMDPAELLETAASGSTDAVVAGRVLPGPGDRDGPSLVDTLRGRAPDLPVVLCTGDGDEETAARAVKADATAYVRRDTADAFKRVAAAVRDGVEASDDAPAADGSVEDAALRDLLGAATGTSTLAGRLEALLEVGCEQFDLPIGFLSHIDDRFRIVAAHGDHDEIQAGAVTDIDRTYCERLLGESTAATIPDVAAAWGEDDPRLERWGLRCYIGTEVRVHGTPYGTLCFVDTEPQETSFRAADRTLLDLLGQWAGYELARQDRVERLEQRTRRLDEFTGIVTHDLRNSLAVAAGYLDLARARSLGDDDQGSPAEHFDRTNRALNRMDDIIDRALRLTEKGRTLDRQPVELSTLVERAWLRSDTGDAVLSCAQDREVTADPAMAVELLRELFGNAVHHGGATHITVTGTEEGFAVADNGSGIPNGEHGLLFERGSSDGPGAGLGLHVVSCVADAHDWAVRTDTPDPERGARFEVVTETGTPSWPAGVGAGRPSPHLAADSHHARERTDDDRTTRRGERERI